MAQIKIFEGVGNNEAEVNAWLAENPDVQVLKYHRLELCARRKLYGEEAANKWALKGDERE